MVLAQLWNRQRRIRFDIVSIPLWFSLNRERRSVIRQLRPFVSIPLWFSLNGAMTIECTASVTGFHPTMVLAQPFFYQIGTIIFMFPSHYGSRSTPYRRSAAPWERVFPSHYGSRSTSTPRLTSFSSRVSIPLWFSLNHFNCSAKPAGTCRFHPTMVLAQRGTAIPVYSFQASFHPTMVLAQLIILS